MYGLSQFQRFFPQYSPQVQPKFTPSRCFSDDDDTFKISLFCTPYETPTVTDMLVIVPFFNPCNSVRILQNMLLVKSKLEQSNIPFIIIHCLFPNSLPLGTENDHYMIVRSNSYAFIKENLANIVIRKHYNDFDMIQISCSKRKTGMTKYHQL